ncbi:crotonase/enoyl-CoA hydratase family protein [Novosphingobium sp. MMS21-SN21R]|uniref:crotonase/enoyl-CoA hydratase family protein n=1 Tax=Novosphingobium sp. MMS21-SN21R TaxID=2969298 RepID=UPI00288682D9|nr:crotonase/enoyl-CoA hydratase family protein [Novosphingobium sp. MMS21-SN21R]MDT0507381.1 crotonase/enoyl-CoA hydratase family protein [Novosphingobium sp. MMS21-SN21R]
MSEVLTEVEGNVLVITINRPEAKNAVNQAVAQGIAAALDRLDAESDLRCAIITGAGGTFCSGMDLKAFVKGEKPHVEGRGFAGIAQRGSKKPLIAAVDGYALAGGMEVALACDLIVASATAQFGIPEAKRGLAAAAGGLIKLPRQIPPRIAMELALTGDFIGAERAYELGFINRISQGPALDEARSLAERIAANGPMALIASKAVVSQSHEWSEAEMWDKQQAIVGPVFMSSDAREGATAFAEKRKPNWQGK